MELASIDDSAYAHFNIRNNYYYLLSIITQELIAIDITTPIAIYVQPQFFKEHKDIKNIELWI